MPDKLIGAQAAADLLGVTRQRVHQLAANYPDFPVPVAMIGRSRVWRHRDVAAWQRRHAGRSPGYRHVRQREQ